MLCVCAGCICQSTVCACKPICYITGHTHSLSLPLAEAPSWSSSDTPSKSGAMLRVCCVCVLHGSIHAEPCKAPKPVLGTLGPCLLLQSVGVGAVIAICYISGSCTLREELCYSNLLEFGLLHLCSCLVVWLDESPNWKSCFQAALTIDFPSCARPSWLTSVGLPIAFFGLCNHGIRWHSSSRSAVSLFLFLLLVFRLLGSLASDLNAPFVEASW